MLVGNYLADRALSEGALGRLYEGVERSSQLRVVIRMLAGASAPDVSERLKALGRTLARLESAGAVGIRDCGRAADGTLYLVSAFVEGQSLADVLAKRAGQPLAQAMRLGARLAELLAEAHAQGIWHLMLRPSQILVPPSGEPLLLGLGIAQALGRGQVGPGGLARVPFAAPEQHPDPSGQRPAVDGRVDVFSLGVLLWQALSGVNPFAAHSGPFTGSAPTFVLREPRPPARLVDLVMRMTAATPAARPLMREVAELLAGLSPTDAPAQAAPRRDSPGQAAPPPDGGDDSMLSVPLPELPPDEAEATTDPNIGKLFGNFRVEKKIGVGGMGVVYLARHRKIGRLAAVKIMHKEFAQDRDYAKRFLNEARAVNIVQHPGLVEIFEYGKLPDETLYFVMEFLQGEPLRKRMQSRGRFTEVDAVRLGGQLARALAAAHAKGIIHRDLKPENIILSPDPLDEGQERVKVLDFGIAKLSRPGIQAGPTKTNAFMGTYQYMPPEQHGRAEEVDGKADVFSLGAMLYELLSGELPFQGNSLSLLNRPALPLARVNPAVSASLSVLVGRMLAPLASERPTMDEVAQRLGARQRRSVGLRVPRWLYAAAGAAVLLLAVGLFVGLRTTRLSPTEAREQALQVLEAGLGSAKVGSKIRAIEALGQSGDMAHRSLLEPLLTSREPQVAAAAAQSLGRIGAVGAQGALLELLKRAPPTSVRMAAADALARLKHPTGVAVLTQALEQESAQDRLVAAKLLLTHGNLTGAQLLWEQIGRGALTPQAAVVIEGGLAQAGDVQARHALDVVLKSGERGPQRLYAAFSLGRLDDEAARQALLDAAGERGPDQVLASQMLAALGELAGYDVMADVARSNREPDESRELAIVGLADSGEEALDVLGPLLHGRGTSESLRIAAAGAVLRILSGDRTQLAQQSLSWAKAALGSDSVITRELAAAALGEISSEESIPPLSQALRDAERVVRRTAARSLGRKSARAALSALASSLDDQDVEVREAGLRAISKVVRSLRSRGDKESDPIIRARLDRLAREGGEQDRVVASGILAQIGESGQAGRLREALGSQDSLVRKLAIELGEPDQALLEQALTDADSGVRLAAARQLADRGSRLGVPVLREAVRGGELDGLVAYGRLKKLGESVAPPEGLSPLLQSAELQTRLDVVETIADLPAERTLPLLYLASHDQAPAVRRRVVSVAASLQGRTGSSAAVALIRLLRHDPDALVRSGAAEALLSIPRRKGSPETRKELTERQVSTPPVTKSAMKTEPQGATVARGEGRILFVGEESVRLQIDRGPSFLLSATPVVVSAGKHRISNAYFQVSVDVPSGETVTVNVTTSYAEQLVDDGIAAYQAKRLDQAEQAFNRLRKLEQKGRVKRSLLPEISYYLARIYEDRRDIPHALQEYSRLREMQVSQPRADLRASTEKAMARLAPSVGHIVLFRKDVQGKCNKTDLYLSPGTHFIDLGLGKSEPVRAAAGVTSQINKCQP